MKLAIVSPYPPQITGIGQYGFHVSRVLAQSGQFQDISILAGSRATRPPVQHLAGLQVHATWRPDSLSAGPAILAALRREAPDLAWLNLGASVFGRSPLANLMAFLSLASLRVSGLPTVVTLHELVELADLHALRAPGGRLARRAARWFTRLAARADVICLTMRRYVEWFAAHHPRQACLHIPIGAYQSPEFLPESPAPELLFFASLAPYKGIEVLLEAYDTLLKRYPALRLTIAGAEHPRFPGYAAALRGRYARLPGVRWLVKVPEEQVRGLFARSQIVVLPYRAATGSSSVLYQAAMWGRALVASDLPDVRMAAVESGLDFAAFPNGDPAGLARAIDTLLVSPESRCAQVERNFLAIQRRRPEVTGSLYLQAFNLALEAHCSPQRIEIPALFSSELAG